MLIPIDFWTSLKSWFREYITATTLKPLPISPLPQNLFWSSGAYCHHDVPLSFSLICWATLISPRLTPLPAKRMFQNKKNEPKTTRDSHHEVLSGHRAQVFCAKEGEGCSLMCAHDTFPFSVTFKCWQWLNLLGNHSFRYSLQATYIPVTILSSPATRNFSSTWFTWFRWPSEARILLRTL